MNAFLQEIFSTFGVPFFLRIKNVSTMYIVHVFFDWTRLIL
jgi:hypothetical protein